MRRLISRLLRIVFFWGLGFFNWEPWERLEPAVHYGLFGSGSRHDFRWYFEGASGVAIDNIDALCDWLIGCDYIRDPELFNEPDFWQHPRTFEQLRRGDCEDHALWAWRKLTELGIPAELYVGQWRADESDEPGSHAWVVCKYEGRDYVFEATAHDRQSMLKPLDDVRAEYIPHFCVDQHFQSSPFGGYMLHLKEQRAKARRRKRDARTA